MKVLLINGSPHIHGCTDRALQEISRTLGENEVESEIFHIGVRPVSGCIDCKYCFREEHLHTCVFDDPVNLAVSKLAEADGLIVGAPVYFSSPNGSLISFLDRLFRIAPNEYLEHKPGAAVISARRAGTTASFDVLNKYFTIRQMPVVSSQYWNMVHGYTPEDVEQDKEGLQIMRTLARNMAWMLKAFEAAKLSGIYPPKGEEPLIRTNFI